MQIEGLREYTKQVIKYVELEYGIESISIEEFEKLPHSNILMNLVFDYFIKEQPFQNCSYELVKYLKQLQNLPM
jgi:hypothetical protein